ncbi:MAG: hypothetical protein P1Q69_20245 [Candidatus Thorarchaeota archaeon]|nr:hypothetical protein [Candidatus Thorarchaeota archaeon]
MEPTTHKPSSKNPNWNESYYFIFYDKKNKIGGMSRIGFKPNKSEGMTFLFLFLPEGSVAAYNAYDEATEYPNRLKVEGMTHQPNADGSWKYTFDGALVVVEDSETLPRARQEPNLIKDLVETSLDLHFKPIHEEYEYSAHMTPESLELGKKSGDMHWEQIAIVNGTIRIEDTVYEITDCMAQRDHTHGIRDWTGVGNWFYFVVWFNENLAINPAVILMDDGRLSTGGFIFKDGKNTPLIDITIKNHEFREDGVFPESTILEITDADGNIHILKGTPGDIIPVPFEDADGNKSILVQAFGSFHLDDIDGGYGSYEVLRRLNRR